MHNQNLDHVGNISCKIMMDVEYVNNTASGKVQIISEQEITMKPAVIEIRGIATCSWTSDKILIKFPRFFKKKTDFSSNEQFFFIRHTLCGGDAPHKQKDEQTYPFTCYWPSRLPGTWTGEHGHIIYYITVKIILAEADSLFQHTQEMVVTPRRDITLEKHLLFEGGVEVQRNFRFCIDVGVVTVNLWTPISGIAAGQALPVLCSVSNQSNLHFGGLIFVLTRLEVYHSQQPIRTTKTVRTDICRIARMTHIHQDNYLFYSALITNKDTWPTSLFYNCSTCQVIYEVWVSLQGAFERFGPYGYPNIDTPGIPVVIGTTPLRNYDVNKITTRIFNKLYETRSPIIMEETFLVNEEVKKIMEENMDEMDDEIIKNLNRQLEEEDKNIQKKATSLDFHIV